MPLQKDNSIVRLVTRLGLEARGWTIVDHWEADLSAVGIAPTNAPGQIVYVSTFGQERERYYYQCESPKGGAPEDYEVVCEGNNATFDEILAVMVRHFSPNLR